MRPSTFSIVACDLERQEWGVAVASKFLAAGALESWARADAGAIATQALAKVGYGPEGLAMLAEGTSAEDTLAALIDADPGAADRQVDLVDRAGRVAAHTGNRCIEWGGHILGRGYACQGNILTGPETLEAMAQAFEDSRGELANRLLGALRAADQAGGDRRGKQSSGLLVVRPGGGYGGDTDRYLDLRVDDHRDPVGRLEALVKAHHIFFGEGRPEDQLPIDAELAAELQGLAKRLGFFAGEVDGVWDEGSKQVFARLVANENLEERWSLEESPDRIDGVVLSYLRERFDF